MFDKLKETIKNNREKEEDNIEPLQIFQMKRRKLY